MVKSIHATKVALGDGIKAPQPSEIPNINVTRKSLVETATIRTGEPFTTENLGVKRPGTGISPMNYWSYIGRIASIDYKSGTLIRVEK